MARSASSVTSPAFLFVMTTGIVNLLGDITYEGGASINGPFMLRSAPARPSSASRRGSASFSATPCGCRPVTQRIGRGATG
jgi:hypothetical protein